MRYFTLSSLADALGISRQTIWRWCKVGRVKIELEEFQEIRLSPAICVEVFYSLTFSLEIFLQQQDRIHRIGQTKDCRYYLLVTNSPVEQGLIDKLKMKQELRDFVLEDILAKAQEQFMYRNI